MLLTMDVLEYVQTKGGLELVNGHIVFG